MLAFFDPVVSRHDTFFWISDTSAAGAYPPSGPGGPPSFNRQAPQTPSDDQEVTKTASSVRATGTQTMPPVVEAS